MMASLIMLSALLITAVAGGIIADFELGDGSVSHGYEFGRTIEGLEFRGGGKPVLISLCMIKNKSMFLMLNRFWTENILEDMDDIDADLFSRFIRATNNIQLEGDMLRRFSRNIARKALLGKHSRDIFRAFPFRRSGDWKRELLWEIFVAFAAEAGCDIWVSDKREIALYSSKESEEEIYDTFKFNFDDKKLLIRKLSVKCRTMGFSGDSHALIPALAWFTWNLRITSLLVDFEFETRPDQIQHLAEAASHICALRQKGEIESGLLLEGLDIPHCSNLGFKTIETLISSLHSIKELNIGAKELRPEAADAFKGCGRLERLSLYGDAQTLSFFKTLMPHLPSLKELEVKVENLDGNIGDILSMCKRLEWLEISGHLSSGFFENLLKTPLTNSLKTLSADLRDYKAGQLSHQDIIAVKLARAEPNNIIISITKQ